jgi:hypothetical protein
MPLEITATCLCGATRQTANHWFLGRVDGSRGRKRHLAVLSYSLAEAQRGGDILCGEVCLHKWVAGKLGELGERIGERVKQSEKKAEEAL